MLKTNNKNNKRSNFMRSTEASRRRRRSQIYLNGMTKLSKVTNNNMKNNGKNTRDNNTLRLSSIKPMRNGKYVRSLINSKQNMIKLNKMNKLIESSENKTNEEETRRIRETWKNKFEHNKNIKRAKSKPAIDHKNKLLKNIEKDLEEICYSLA